MAVSVTASEARAGDEESHDGPGLGSFDGRLYLAWVGLNDQKLNVMRSDRGVDWRAKVRLDETSEKSPTLSSGRRGLYLAWIGRNDRNLNIIRSPDGIDF